MNATPDRQAEDSAAREELAGREELAVREELARLLPAPAAPELSASRQLLLKEHLMDSITEAPSRRPARRRFALAIALPVALAAAVAGVLLVGGSGDNGDSGEAGGRGAGPRILGSVTNVAYTLESTTDTVRLIILENNKPVDTDQLQRDLDKFGIRARVYAGEPGCRAKGPKIATHDNDDGWHMEMVKDKMILTARPDAIPAGEKLFIYLPLAKSSPENGFRELESGLMKSPGPACMPSREFVNPLASLLPTP
ncbi:hypothetical protein [Streptomyces sp. NRRL WC-3742]|uniref:hypothetical protein n=1 Tax=Streptomyces sp. NRRL WC-3742 TaxID=1463934 RepID=UPI0004C81D75|nr:hypothetical protein [Streptomyces sp. NRRL WC-3742]